MTNPDKIGEGRSSRAAFSFVSPHCTFLYIHRKMLRYSYMTHPIQLYSLATPNGQKVSIALEEMEIPYKAHTIDIRKDEQKTDDFLALNPNGKIPVIVDPDGPDGTSITLFESGAILEYLADKTGQFLPKSGAARYETLKWLYFQMGQVGPMFGQFGHFFAHSGKDECDHSYPVNRYQEITTHTLGVLEHQLSTTEFLAGAEYTIADIATFPWIACLDEFYHARETLALDSYPHIIRWFETCTARPAAERGRKVCPVL